MAQVFLAPFFDLVFGWYDLRLSVSESETDVLEPVRELVRTHQGIFTIRGTSIQVFTFGVLVYHVLVDLVYGFCL